MIRSNVDVIAIFVLIAAAALGSYAQKIVVWDPFSNQAMVLQRSIKGPTVNIVSLLPLFPCSRK